MTSKDGARLLNSYIREAGRFIPYTSILAQAVGNPNATLLLCNLLAWAPLANNPDDIYKSNSEIEVEIGLTPTMQRTARERLQKDEWMNFWKGKGGVTHYTVNFRKVALVIGPTLENARNASIGMKPRDLALKSSPPEMRIPYFPSINREDLKEDALKTTTDPLEEPWKDQ